MIVTGFQYADEFISNTNREKAQAKIWSMIDDEDVSVLVEVILDAGKRSRIVATAVRKTTRSYNLLRAGLITGPKFVETFKFYADHGGFVLPLFGGTQHAREIPIESERENVSSRQ